MPMNLHHCPFFLLLCFVVAHRSNARDVVAVDDDPNKLIFDKEFEKQCEIYFQHYRPGPLQNNNNKKTYNCSLPGLRAFAPGGQYEGVTANYLSHATSVSSPNFPIRAREFQACTGGSIVFSESINVFQEPLQDLGTSQTRGFEVYDAYFMSYSHFPEASALGLAEQLNDRVRADNDRLKWEDILPKVRRMGEYRSKGKTNLEFLLYDGDFFVPVVRLDLLEQHNLPLPNTWEEVVEYAKFFNNTDLNDDGEPDFGFCHFPRTGAGSWDWWFPESVYSTWATYDQTLGTQQGFLFDAETMEPNTRSSPGFKKAVQFWKQLWLHGAVAESSISPDFITGRCAIGFAPPGSWKRIFLEGISRKDANGTIIWQPRLKSGEYAEPYRFKPFGSTQIFDRATGTLVECTPELCPKGEPIPARGHMSDKDRASLILPPSPLQGKLINRSPYYWSGGLGTLIRKSADPIKKDLIWDFFLYTNSPETAVNDVAKYASWLDSWRYSQLVPGDNFLQAGWSQSSYQEHSFIMQWALSDEVNGALNLRIPGVVKYTRDELRDRMIKYIDGSLSLEDLVEQVSKGWERVTLQQGKLNQLEIYRASLGLDPLSEVDLCRLHRDLMDKRDPSICRKYDPAREGSSSFFLSIILIPSLIAVTALVAFAIYMKRKRHADSLWEISPKELEFGSPVEILGRGTFGLVVSAEYRGTQVAVKRVIPPKLRAVESKQLNHLFGLGDVHAGASTDSMSLGDDSIHSNDTDDKQIEMPRRKARTAGARLSSVELDLEKSSAIVASSLESQTAFESGFQSASHSCTLTGKKKGHWRNVFKIKDDYSTLRSNFILEMRRLSKLRHPTITTVMGAVVKGTEEPMLVMECMDHGSLYDILHNHTIPLEGDILLPILRDVAQGLRFLHAASPQVIHGDVKAHNVLVDSRFRAKVTDFGLSAKRSTGATGTPLWMAPELLRGESPSTACSDVYSFGILLYEMYSRKDPYEGEDPKTVLRNVADKKVQKRPPVPAACPPKVSSIMTDCLVEDPRVRPTFEEIDLRLKRLDAENADPEDQLVLSKRTKKMLNATKNEELLFKVFPKHVARLLRDGCTVEPEKKDLVTIFFSDIVGYNSICAALTPEKVSDMLDRLYTRFDKLSDKHGVFKMETIGDAYMGVTNLVESQEDNHVKLIAEFSLDIVHAASDTYIDTENPSMGVVQVRVGFHSGPVIARVVGTRNPKYGIFGDTVNTASRMESHSLPNQIQCSERSASLLALQSPNLQLESRGNIRVKGKGEMQTFFLMPPFLLPFQPHAYSSSSDDGTGV